MRLMGIDYGDTRVGIAITDELNITVQGLETIVHNKNDRIILKRLDEIIEQYNITHIVVGMPYNMDGTQSKRMEITNNFIHKLKCKYNKLEIDYIDERLTTVQANRTMIELDIKSNKKKKLVDTISAVYILESYVLREKNNLK